MTPSSESAETEGLAEVIPGTLHATGGWLEVAARPITWLPPEGRGLIPVQARGAENSRPSVC